MFAKDCCISFVSYIKPQQTKYLYWLNKVVYRSFPTSNHNNIIVVAMLA